MNSGKMNKFEEEYIKMIKKNTVLILGIASMLTIVSVQVYLLAGIWKQRNEMFTLRYTQLSQEAWGYIRMTSDDEGFDLVRALLNDTADGMSREIFTISDETELKKRKKGIFEYFNTVLQKEQVFSDKLVTYFELRGFEKNFKHKLIINNLELINEDDTIIIYRSERFRSRRPGSSGQDELSGAGQGATTETRTALPGFEFSSSEILVTRYQLAGNNFRMFFSYFIDFSDKQQLILREISASLGLSLLSILLVGAMFFITYRNLLEERRLSNLKTDFINNMTHELKTPLSTITVAGRTLEMPQIRSNDDKILETAKLIGKQSVHLNQLINMILEISMWERTQFQLDKKKVDVEDILKDVLGSFRSGGGSSAKIIEKYNLDGVTADIDVVYFTTLLNNLLSNAVKYSNKEPVIEIEGFHENNSIHIRVTDNGIGISKLDQKHIFDKFYRATTGNIHKFKGLGLGLYYVKKIAEAHGGDVSVNSRPGKGSTFIVTIPGATN